MRQMSYCARELTRAQDYACKGDVREVSPEAPCGLTCGVTVHEPACARDRRVAVLYFHGGGLLYGERDDLPQVYIDMLLDAGYTLYCFDYPLAPEMALPGILDAAHDGWSWFMDEEFATRGFGAYVLFGRSAGAYLALMLAGRLQREGASVQPAAIWDFYGYCDMTAAFLYEPSAYYATLPAVGRECLDRLTGAEPVSSGPKPLRFSLYVAARQLGIWAEVLGVSEMQAATACSLSAEDLRALPPVFITASADDQDVPLGCSKSVSRTVPVKKCKWVYGLEHDFDRDVSRPEGREAYALAIEWTNNLLG